MRTLSRAAIVAAVAIALSACSGTSSSGDAALTIEDAWVKAADSGMTAAFGLVTNETDETITIVGAHSASSDALELHEVVDDTMRPVEGGFVIEAGKTLTLEPGGFHIMFMGLPEPIAVGDEVTITLELSDGSEFTFSAPAKEFTGANEDYEGGMDMDDNMDMGSESAMPSMDS